MITMFGSEVVAGIVIDTLSDVTDVTDAVGSRMAGTDFVPQGMALPALLTYTENSVYPAPDFYGGINNEVLRIVVRLICTGTSTTPILAAALAQQEAIHGLVVDVDGGQVIFTATGAIPRTTVPVADGTVYRQLGTVYEVQLLTGG